MWGRDPGGPFSGLDASVVHIGTTVVAAATAPPPKAKAAAKADPEDIARNQVLVFVSHFGCMA